MVRRGICSVQLRLIVLLCVIVAGRVGRADDAPQRLPVPSEEAQAKSTSLIRDLFKNELANRSPEVRRSLAEKFETQAEQTQDDPAAKFVLLRESRDLFARAGAVRKAIGIARQMENQFQIHGAVAETDALVAARGTAKSPEAAVELASTSLGVAVAALHGNDVDNAAKAIKEAEAAITHSTSPLGLRVQAAARRIRAAQQSAEAFAAAIEQLKSDPADRKANLVAGRSLCFDYSRWSEGAPLLARAGDPKLGAIASAEIATPVESSAVVALADAWWDLPEAAGITRAQSRHRARYWYDRALDGTTGLRSLQAAQRISEIDAAGDWPVLDLLALADLQSGGVSGVCKMTEDGLLSDPQPTTRFEFPYRPPREYDFRIVFARSADSAVEQIFRSGENSMLWEMGYGHNFGVFGRLSGPGVILNGVLRTSPIDLIKGHRYTSVVTIRKNRIAAYLDGKMLSEFDPRKYQIDLYEDWRLTHPDQLGVGSFRMLAVFYAIECVEISGRGEIVH